MENARAQGRTDQGGGGGKGEALSLPFLLGRGETGPVPRASSSIIVGAKLVRMHWIEYSDAITRPIKWGERRNYCPR